MAKKVAPIEFPLMVELIRRNYCLFLTEEQGIFLKNIMRLYKSPYGSELNGFPLALKDLLEKTVKEEWKG